MKTNIKKSTFISFYLLVHKCHQYIKESTITFAIVGGVSYIIHRFDHKGFSLRKKKLKIMLNIVLQIHFY